MGCHVRLSVEIALEFSLFVFMKIYPGVERSRDPLVIN